MKRREGRQEKEIVYAIPKYRDGQGDVSMILYEGGMESFPPFHIRTLIRRLAYDYYIDIISLRKRLQEQLGQRNILPYPLHPRLILLPVKVRKPRLKKDGAFGYINYVWIQDIQREGKLSRILFKDGSQLGVLQSYQGIKGKMIQGAWLQECFLPQMQYSIPRNKKGSICREELSQIIGQLMEMYKEL